MKTTADPQLLAMAQHAVAVMESDSGLTLVLADVMEALLTDINKNGSAIPSLADIETMIMGNDEGLVPEELLSAYPCFTGFISSQF